MLAAGGKVLAGMVKPSTRTIGGHCGKITIDVPPGTPLGYDLTKINAGDIMRFHLSDGGSFIQHFPADIDLLTLLRTPMEPRIDRIEHVATLWMRTSA